MKLSVSNKLYVAGTTIWLVVLARIADFNPFEEMTDFTGQILFF